jgi:hypothetical protein
MELRHSVHFIQERATLLGYFPNGKEKPHCDLSIVQTQVARMGGGGFHEDRWTQAAPWV